MAKIKDSEPKTSSGGYDRVIGNNDIALLMQKTQSTVIRNGNELEKIIIGKKAPFQVIPNLDDFIQNCASSPKGVYLCPKKVAKQSQKYSMKGDEPDYLVFVFIDDPVCPKLCHVIELKDGDQFDTKKSSSEHEALEKYSQYIGKKLPFKTEYQICCFNVESKERILFGLKGRFTENEVMTGREFCDMLGISYDIIVKERSEDTKDNIEYFIDTVEQVINHEIVPEEDFYSEAEDLDNNTISDE